MSRIRTAFREMVCNSIVAIFFDLSYNNFAKREAKIGLSKGRRSFCIGASLHRQVFSLSINIKISNFTKKAAIPA